MKKLKWILVMLGSIVFSVGLVAMSFFVGFSRLNRAVYAVEREQSVPMPSASEEDGNVGHGEAEVGTNVPAYLAGVKWDEEKIDETALEDLLFGDRRQEGMTEAEALERGKVIYLTFDDGPSEYTMELLEILDRYQVKATFFVTKGDPDYVDCIGEAARRGHSIGIHCYSHWYKKIYANEDAYLADMKKMDEIIFEQTGVHTKLMRFPGGSSNQVSKQYNQGIMTRLEKIVEGMGYCYFDWNVDSNDAGGTTETDLVAENVISSVEKKDVSVVLQHDSHGYSVAAVEQIIRWGLENGYVFLPLSTESPGMHHGIVN